MVEVPEARYARSSDGSQIAYQVVGDGAVEGAHELKGVPGTWQLYSVPG